MQGQFIDSFKVAKVVPIFKKGDSKSIINYRPISLLPCFSKILERITHSRLISFLDKHQFFFTQQLGFRDKHSTELATTYLISKIINAMEHSEITLGIFLDLSKAFDTINHNILFTKLFYYGIRGLSLEWFKSYLCNRKQLTVFGGKLSNPQLIKHGVPQGSILGPLLCLIYINDIQNSLNNDNAIMYADDTNIFVQNKGIKKVFQNAQQELNNVANWLSANKLLLNVDKTKYVLFHSNRKKLSNCSKTLLLNNKPLKQVNDLLFLGLYINKGLSWKTHMIVLLKKVRTNAAIISKLRYYLNATNLMKVYHALITSHLRYCIMAWNHRNQIIVKKIQTLCNNVIKLIKKKDKNKTIKVMSIKDLFVLETGKFIHKLKYNQLPNTGIFQKLFKVNHAIHSIPTRNKDDFYCKYYSKTLTQQTIEYSGVTVWNSFPNTIKTIQTTSVFISKLKYHLQNRETTMLCYK